jgi:hypothetical protein
VTSVPFVAQQWITTVTSVAFVALQYITTVTSVPFVAQQYITTVTSVPFVAQQFVLPEVSFLPKIRQTDMNGPIRRASLPPEREYHLIKHVIRIWQSSQKCFLVIFSE